MKRILFPSLSIVASIGLLVPPQSQAQDVADSPDTDPGAEAPARDEAGSESVDGSARPHLPPPTPSVTEGSVKIAGADIPFSATAGTVTLKDEKGKPSAHVFYVSYLRSDVGDAGDRPVTFCFNGGPGSSAVWLHLGGLGPKKVLLPDDGTTAPKPPARVVSNPQSILDVTDLVFVDPVSTGFSRSQKPDGDREFHGVVEDVHSMGDFIRRWITENRRWGSPKFLLGESYGGLRVAALSSHLQDRFGIYLNGTILVSAVLDFATLIPHPGNDLPYLSRVPSFAAAAHYHKAIKGDAGDLATLLKKAENFTRDEYAPALLLGGDLPEEKKKEIAGRLAGLTGLDPDFVLRSNLRISNGAFFKELLRSRGKTVGRFDARVLGDDPLDSGGGPDNDPSYSNIYGAYAAAMKGYVREDLKFESDLVYEILTSKVRPWDNSAFEGRYVNVAPMLAGALQKNEHLQVLALCGYTDLATPYFGMEYSLAHLPIDPKLRGNIAIKYYDSGHMMYNNVPDLIKMRKDLVEFIDGATK